jgi:hypothetical protein
VLRFTFGAKYFYSEKSLEEPWGSFIFFPNGIKIKYGAGFKFYFLKNQKPLRIITSHYQ